MAKLSQIKLGNTTYDIGAAWGNITGKPSTFTPASHTHNYAGSPSAGGPANSANLLNLNHGSLSSTASTSRSSWNGAVSGMKYVWGQSFFDSSIGTDSGDLVFGLRAGQYTSGGTELCLMLDGDYYSMGNKVLHAGNYSSYAATKDHNHDSTYVTLSTNQTISGTKTMTGSLKVSGRYVGSGDDEGIIVGFANNGYAGLCLGGPGEARSVFYFKSDGSSPFWRYNNGSASYDILHPGKSGTIALTSDLDGYAKLASPNNLIHSGNEFTFASDAYSGDLYINYRTANNAQNGNITAYRFCKGAGGTLSDIVANAFIGKLTGNADTATVSTRSKYLETWYNEKDKTYGASYPLYAWWETGSECRLMVDNYTVKVNYADSAGYANSAGTCTSLSTNAGSTTKAIYFTGGKPAQCNTTLDHSISGNAATATNATNATNADKLDNYHATSFGINHNSGDVNLDTCTQSGFYRFGGAPTNAFTNAAWSQMLVVHGAGDTICQVGMPYNERAIYIRQGNPSNVGGSGTWQGWKRLWGAGDSVTGAVWNDYAECRESDCEEFGYVLMETGKDSLTKTTERLSHFAGISSDTWGFSQGETEKAKTPIAVAGRVLAYPFRDKNKYKPGDCVCAAPGGTVDIMTREEVINWPDRIVGTVSCVPDYEEWGGQDDTFREAVKVNGRIWIKVK